MPFNYTITANTVFEVTINTSNAGEIMGLGLDNNLSTGKRMFRLGGNQANGNFYDITPFYTANSGSYVHTIVLGQYYTGSITYLVSVADNDVPKNSDITFTNVRVYENP